MDCGPACLKIIAQNYGKRFSLKYLRDRCYATREGVSLFDIGGLAAEENWFPNTGYQSYIRRFNREDAIAINCTLETKSFRSSP
ncbi:cysteine peptidase family C39 domain-containing protein [Bacteroides fragilis]|nr:cysteine peptidase family C39 domain-containing protein [Bacteroides fragilis]